MKNLIGSPSEKIIRDPIHGYISIPKEYLRKFVDTRQFQRLHHIKQNNLYVLYPSATHTRFEHSLGVFHIGRSILDAIIAKQKVSKVTNTIKKLRTTVELACLLHDIGHAPLSHLGESFYSINDIWKDLRSIDGVNLEQDNSSSEHEVMSCLVALKIFENELADFNVDKDYFCRLITGIEYEPDVNFEENIKNCLINILNGYFDADKMDYIMRDSQSAGIPTLTLDIPRIVNSFNIVEDNGQYHFVIEKSGFSVTCNVINNRNYLYFWVNNHHKVQYHSELIRRYLKTIKDEHDLEFNKLFSYKAITGSIKLDLPALKSASYVDDSDIHTLMKYYPRKNSKFKSYIDQIYTRNHFKPLWKTHVEYAQIRNTNLGPNVRHIEANAKDSPENKIEPLLVRKTRLKKNRFIIFLTNPKLLYPKEHSDAHVYLPNEDPPIKSFVTVFKDIALMPKGENSSTLLAFFDPDLNFSKKEFIKALQSIKIKKK